MSGEDRPPKYAQIPINHLPSWKRPFKFISYVVSILIFNYLTYREVASQSEPTDGLEGKSVLGRFQHWFYIRLRTYLFIAFLAGTLLLIYQEVRYPGTLPLQIYGLTLDMIGAIIVARGLYRGYSGFLTDANIVPPEVRNPENPGMGRPSNRERRSLDSEIRASVDALLGATFLISGFLAQMVAII